MIRSDYIINKIAAAFHIESTDKDSVYTDFCSKDGNNRRVRFSNHGVILSTWYKHQTEPYQLNKSKNIALTFLMTKDECKEKNVTFSTSAVNKTKVLNDLGIPIDDNFKVMHYIYQSWKIEEAHIELIIKAIDSFINRIFYFRFDIYCIIFVT